MSTPNTVNDLATSDVEEEIAEVNATRDSIRQQILKSRKAKSKIVEVFGTKIELRQPTFGSVLEAQSSVDRKSAILDALINNAFVPGTDDKVFTKEDEPELLLLPMGSDLLKISSALEELSEVNFQNSATTSDGAPPLS